MNDPTRADLLRTLDELTRARDDAPPELRPLIAQQLDAVRSTLALWDATAYEREAAREHTRRPLPEAVQQRFRAEPPEPPPAWVADTVTRDTLRDEDLRCPPAAAVYASAETVGCARPGVAGVRLSTAHGLRLTFFADGALARQEFFDEGVLRWSVEYHPTGGRASEGLYAGTEPKTYLEHGLHTRYAPDGTIVAQCRWVAGRRHGWQRLWENDGYPIGATRFSDDREVERVLPDDAQ